jgi:hypothetical protein
VYWGVRCCAFQSIVVVRDQLVACTRIYVKLVVSLSLQIYNAQQVVAIKKVLQDKRFKNRELQIMRMLVKQVCTTML